ncbi:MAG: RNA methyltransferase [Propionibacteriales bacterium]|nr:RNA methyltransferase [Propionibacteriales bacterium]
MTGFDDELRPEITSPTNPRVKWLVSLRKRRTRDAERVTVLEGFDELTLALDAGVTPRQLFWCDAFGPNPAGPSTLQRVAALGCDVVALGAAAFDKASYRESPDGWLAVVDNPETALDELVLGRVPLVLVCEAIEKPGNLGAMLRTAEAVGVDAVVAASHVADWGNPNVVRASKGTVFAVPVSSASSTEVVDWLRRRGLTIVVASPDADDLVTDVELAGPTAIVVGSEHAGVSSHLRRCADKSAALPMVGRVNSLNVATSAAVLLYEAVRQRGLAE